MRPLAIGTLLLTLITIANASDLARTALLVESDNPDAQLTEALKSTDAQIRATAARVVAVRNRESLLPQIEKQLDTEPSPEVARELVRAAILVGGENEIDKAIATSARFNHRLDTSVAIATARLGTDVATRAYATKLTSLHTPQRENFFTLALWGTPQGVPVMARVILAKHDEETWREFLAALMTSSIALDPDALASGLTDASAQMRLLTLDAMIEEYEKNVAMSDAVKQRFLQVQGPEDEPAELSFRRELLRRVAGAPAKETTEWLAWMTSDQAADAFGSRTRVIELMTNEERAALRKPKRQRGPIMGKSKYQPIALLPPQFYTPDLLPDGVADSILLGTACRAEWIGVGSMTVDRAGRVTSLDLSNVDADSNCRRALNAVTRLGLVHPTAITSRFETKVAVFAKADRTGLCIDEGLVPQLSELNLEACNPFLVGDESTCKPPVVKRRPDPEPRAFIRSGNSIVILEALITESGCVRSARLVAQSPFAELNRAAILALLRWRFEPGKVAGVPVPVLFNLTINYTTQKR